MEPRSVVASKNYREHKELFFPLGDGHGVLLLDLSQPEAQQLWIDVFEQFINDYGADWIWIDYNVNPRTAHWDKHEKPDRKGMLELGFYQGWYRVVDYIMKKYPHVWIESCASGGRIIDLAQLRRSHSIWINDHDADDDANRNLRSGANHLLPAVVIQVSIFLNSGIDKNPPDPETADLGGGHRFLTYFGGALGFVQGICFWKDKDIQEAAKYTALYKKYRHYLEKDYYHLFPMPESRNAWDGWQYHDPETDSGIILLFRLGDSKEASKVVSLRGIKNARAMAYSLVSGEATLREADNGLEAVLPANRAVLIHYQQK